MRSFALLSFLIFFSAGFDKKPPVTEICLSREEKKLYDLIMDYRKSKKLPPISLSQKLTLVAQTHARDLSEHYEFDPKGECNPHSWSDKGNWSSCCYTNDHKVSNCMWSKPQEIANYSGAGYEIVYYSSLGANAKEGLDGWKVSPGHNPLMINTGTWSKVKWNAIGIAIYKQYGIVWFGEVEDNGTVKICQ